MANKIKITDQDKKENGVRIEFEVTLDSSSEKISIPEGLDGEKVEGHFNLDYETFRDNSQVKRHAQRWARHYIHKRIEEYNPSESAEGMETSL